MSMHESQEKCVECKQEMLVQVYGFTNPMSILCPACWALYKEKKPVNQMENKS